MVAREASGWASAPPVEPPPPSVERRRPDNGLPTWIDADAPASEDAGAARGPELVRRRDSVFRRSIGLADVVSLNLALILSTSLLGDDRLTLGVLVLSPLFVLVLKAAGLYERDPHLLHKTTLDEAPSLFGIATVTSLLVWLSDGWLIQGPLGRGQILGMWLLLFAFMVCFRALARGVVNRFGPPPERCMFVGDIASATVLSEQLKTGHAVGAKLVGWIPVEGGDRGLRRTWLPELIRELAEERDVHRIILGPGPATSDGLLDEIRKEQKIKVSVLPDVARVVNHAVDLDRIGGITLLGLRQFTFSRSSRIMKRALDVAGSALALVLTSPLLIAIAIAIKLDSPGPVLFRQRRAGRHGEPFQMLKFRSMVDQADQRQRELWPLNECADGLFKIADDPRITRVGRLIRRLHMDELPQLGNVLRGEMSLVGPRPLVPAEDGQIEGWRRRRLDLRPGITGPWQVLGSSRIPVREMVKLDYQYIANWSIWNDLRLVLLTIPRVLGRHGL